MIPLMACLPLSIRVNNILLCRLRKRKQGYDLDEKNPKMIEATSVKHQEKDKMEPGWKELGYYADDRQALQTCEMFKLLNKRCS